MKNHAIIRSLLCAALMAGLLAAPSDVINARPNATIVVDTASSALLSACTAAAGDCSLPGAVAYANANGGTIITFDASYTINLTAILSINAAGTQIQGGSNIIMIQAPPGDTAVAIYASSVRLQNLRIYGGPQGYAVVYVGSGKNIEISDNTIGDNGDGVCDNSPLAGYGVYIAAATPLVDLFEVRALLLRNTINCIRNNDPSLLSGEGVHIENTAYVVVRDNTIVNNGGSGVFINGALSQYNDVLTNTLHGNYIGIQLVGTHYNRVSGNIVGSSFNPNRYHGLLLGYDANFNTIGRDEAGGAPNVIWFNGGDGIRLTNVNSNTIAGNNIDRNSTNGIVLDFSRWNRIGIGGNSGSIFHVGNTISGNSGNGLMLASGSNYNTVKDNRILGDAASPLSPPSSSAQRNGIVILSSSFNEVGGRVLGGGGSYNQVNLISRHRESGISVLGVSIQSQVCFSEAFGNRLYGDTLTENEAGITIYDCAKSNELHFQTVQNNRDAGFRFAGENIESNWIDAAQISDNFYGIHISQMPIDGYQNRIFASQIFNNGVGIFNKWDAPQGFRWHFLRMYGNVFDIDVVDPSNPNVNLGTPSLNLGATITGFLPGPNLLMGSGLPSGYVEVYKDDITQSAYNDQYPFVATQTNASGYWSATVSGEGCYRVIQHGVSPLAYRSSEFSSVYCTAGAPASATPTPTATSTQTPTATGTAGPSPTPTATPVPVVACAARPGGVCRVSMPMLQR